MPNEKRTAAQMAAAISEAISMAKAAQWEKTDQGTWTVSVRNSLSPAAGDSVTVKSKDGRQQYKTLVSKVMDYGPNDVSVWTVS